MTLLLHCTLCGRKQADGLLSRNAWGHLPLDDGSVLRACFSCRGQYSDWDVRLRATVSTNAILADESTYGWRPEANSA
ncbi:hypothetical protein BH18ACT14_BH18ACT14_07780 [soil metagenome]